MGRVSTNDLSSELHSFMAKKLYFLLPSKQSSLVNFHYAFQLKQAFDMFKCNMGERWNIKGPICACVARCLSNETGKILKAALIGVSHMGFDSSSRGTSPSLKPVGVCGDLCLPFLNICSVEAKILTSVLRRREKAYPFWQGNTSSIIRHKCLFNVVAGVSY